MYSSQDWAIALTLLRNKAADQAAKLPRRDDSDADGGLGSRIEILEAKLVDYETAFNNLVDALRETDEKLGRAEGMLRYCYAICQNPGIKDLADRSKESASTRLAPLGGRPYTNGRLGGGGGNAPPRAGLGSAGRP